jgi:CheY-like chemotaxis protein
MKRLAAQGSQAGKPALYKIVKRFYRTRRKTMEKENQQEYLHTQVGVLQQALKSLLEQRELAEKLRRANLKAAKAAEQPGEIRAIEERYQEEKARLDTAIRKTEEQIQELQAKRVVKKRPILLVDDEKNIRLTLSQSLEPLGLPIQTAVNGEEALQKLDDAEFGLLLLDLKMPGMDGMEVLHRVRERWPTIPVIIITAHGTIESAVDAMKIGAVDFIQKPFSPREIRELVTKVLQRESLKS